LAITLDSTVYLKGKVINNLIVSRRSILAFQHEAPHFHLIDRESSKTEEKKWPCGKKSCIIGAQLAPDFHADEMSSYNAKTVAVLCSIKCLKRFNKANNVM